MLVGSTVLVALGGPAPLFLFAALLALLLLHEFYQLMATGAVSPQAVLGMVLGAVLFGHFAAQAFFGFAVNPFWVVAPGVVLFPVVELFRNRPNPVLNIAVSLFGVVYTTVPLLLWVKLGFTATSYNALFPLAFFVFLWTQDTMAFVFGFLFGKRRLFPRHSPKKTWEGLAGGTFSTLAIAWGVGQMAPVLTLGQWVLFAALVSIFSTFGDLFESMLPSSHNKTDSGQILPGHGGLLDRFDGALLALPMVYVYIQMIS